MKGEKTMKERIFKTDSETAVEKLEKKLQYFQGLPFMKRIQEEGEAAILERRQTAAAIIQQAKAEFDSLLPALRTDIEKKDAEAKQAQLALNAAVNACHEARRKLSAATSRWDSIKREQEEILFSNYDFRIDEAIGFFNEKLQWLRSPGRFSHGRAGAERNVYTDIKLVKEESNINAVRKALIYCQNAIQELEGLKLVPTLDTKKLEEMKRSIPDISVYEEFTGEKPLEKAANPVFSLLSDSHLDYVKGKLLEKVERTLHPKKKASARR
jgi:hypothetical protein